ncbi:MAG TPA: sporulation protein YabP [Firmicutes bacterium]|nr:sporulation protein YabP [Bacillota bacterium]
MDERDLQGVDHTVSISNRERLEVRGVSRVESFDEEEIVLETDLGMLTVRGQDLHIQNVDVEQGNFCVEGVINGLQYSALPRVRGVKGKSRGLWDRLMR